MTSEVSVSTTIAAPPEAVYDLVADLPRMGEWSPENRGGRWLRGASGPVLGARFKGHNRNGWRRWSTVVTVSAADRGKRFAFHVSAGPFPVAEWRYDFEAAGDGTVVTESWTDRRPAVVTLAGDVLSGLTPGDRPAHNRRGMEQTLARLKRAAEAPPAA